MGECVRDIAVWVGKGGKAILDSLPPPPSLLREEQHHVVMVGLDSAGKTTVLYRLKFDQVR